MSVAAPTGAPSFGNRLREYRTAAGLSQEALAERAGLSTRAISDLERGIKTRPHPNTLRMLADALELDPEARASFAAASRPTAAPAPPAPAVAVLPVRPHPMVGRQAELETARALLARDDVRLLTLTGPGGVGKTRLSLEIAAAFAPTMRVTVVELAPLPRGAEVTPAIAARLGIRDEGDRPLVDLIEGALANEPHLLVLDNCEHVLPGVQGLAAALRDVAGLRILASSRGPLRLTGERVLPIAPLSLPGTEDAQEVIADSAAVRLFVERAGAVRPGFALTGSNAAAVAEICRRLDGLPLAIELAAAWMRLVTPEDLAPMLDKRLRLLTGGPSDVAARHQTLHAAIDWSYGLLEEPQRALFRRLAVFPGGCTLDAVAAVATDGDPFAALEGLDTLADQALLNRITDDESRFGMLETVRDYALTRLDEHAEADEARRKVLTWLVALAERAVPMLGGPAAHNWLDQLAREQDNVRMALSWAIGTEKGAGDPAMGLRLATALWPYWHMRGLLHEGHAWLEQAVAAGSEADPATRAAALLGLANIANNLEDHHRARGWYEESLRLHELIGNQAGVASAAMGLGMVATSQGRLDDAAAYLERSRRSAGDTSDAPHRIAYLYAQGRLAAARGAFPEAEAHFTTARALCDPRDPGTPAYLDLELAQLARYQGRRDEATALATGCLNRFRDLGERRAEAASLAELGCLALDAGEHTRATGLLLDAAALHLDLRDEFGIVRCLEALARLGHARGLGDQPLTLLWATTAWRTRTGTARTAAERAALAPLLDRVPSVGLAPRLDHALDVAREAMG